MKPVEFALLHAVSIAFCSYCTPAAAQSGEADLFVHDAQDVGTADTIILYDLPTRTSDGKVRYWDTTIVIGADAATGKPNTVSVSAVKAPAVKRSEFQTGTYTPSSAGASPNCTVTASPFAGRTQFDLRCIPSSGPDYVATWYTGPIAGHPFESALRAAGLDLIPGSSEYSWGQVLTNGSNTYYGCFNFGELISARQIGDQLTLINWDDDDQINCQQAYNRTPAAD